MPERGPLGRSMKNKLIMVMAYMYMPLLFAFLGCGLLSLLSAPMLRLINSTLDIILVEETSDQDYELKTIYNADIRLDNIMYQEGRYQSGTDKACLKESKTESTDTENTIRIEDIQFPKLGEHYGMISCDRIQLEVPVYWGDTQKILSAGVGHFMGSFLPGFNRSILLSAHNNTFFRPLELIRIGDIIEFATNYGEFQYVIDEVSVIKEEDAEKMLDHMLGLSGEKLIMYTCYPFSSFVSNKEKRLFVYANKISGPEVEKYR